MKTVYVHRKILSFTNIISKDTCFDIIHQIYYFITLIYQKLTQKYNSRVSIVDKRESMIYFVFNAISFVFPAEKIPPVM